MRGDLKEFRTLISLRFVGRVHHTLQNFGMDYYLLRSSVAHGGWMNHEVAA